MASGSTAIGKHYTALQNTFSCIFRPYWVYGESTKHTSDDSRAAPQCSFQTSPHMRHGLHTETLRIHAVEAQDCVTEAIISMKFVIEHAVMSTPSIGFSIFVKPRAFVDRPSSPSTRRRVSRIWMQFSWSSL